MNVYTPLIIEITVMVLLWLAASGLSAPLRRRLSRESYGRVGPASLSLDLFARLSRTILVLGLGELAILACSGWPPASGWLELHANHMTAWRMFWLGVAVIGLLEGIVHTVYAIRRMTFPIPDLLLDIIRAALILGVAFLVLRFELEKDIGPLLASTALLTAVIGFALQGVLGNLLAGMSLHLVGAFRQGQWVSIGDLEGRIMNTNWRETRIRNRDGFHITIPNGKVADAIIHNMQQPTTLRRHIINVGASYSDAPDEVIAALKRSAAAVPVVRTSPAPDAVITEFQDYGINYRLDFWTDHYERHVPIDGAVNRNIWYQFKRKGIEIPFPMSDKLLNDFMAVVYTQRKLTPEDHQQKASVRDLWDSDLCTKVFVDAEGRSIVSRDDLKALAPMIERQPYTQGETVCTQGESGETFWVVARGSLNGKVEQDGKIAAEFTLGEGAVVGEMGALTGVPRSATLMVSESAELLEFGPDAFRALLKLHEDVPEKLADLAAARAAANREALEDLASRREDGADVQLEQPGILKRLLRIIGR